MNIKVNSFHWLSFLLQPFFTTVYYIVHFRKNGAKNVIWAFTAFFALTIAVGSESQGSDIVRYITDVKLLHYSNFTFDSAIKYYSESKEVDILRTFLAILISRFTANGYILVIVFGVIFGYFYSRNMWYILNRVQGKLKIETIILISCLFLIVPIWNLGGFRFYVAVHVFIYGLFPFFFEGKKKKLIWCIITPFIFHYAFILPLVIILLYLIAGNRIQIYFYFFVATLFVSGINIDRFNDLVESYAPSAFVERSKSYRGDEKVQAYRQGEMYQSAVWYAKYRQKFINYPLCFFIIIIYWKYRNVLKSDKPLFRLFCFTLLFYGVANLLSSLPSGSRYLAPAGILAVSLLIIIGQNYRDNKALNRAVKFVSPALILFIVVQLRESWYYSSLFTLIGNPIASFFTIGQNVSINDIVK